MDAPDRAAERPAEADTSTVATLQSLIVAFVLAMTFRGFVTEGFVIPTGSMAPTLMGEHLRLHSGQTGLDFAVDAKGSNRATRAVRDATGGVSHYETTFRDPMLGREYRLTTETERPLRQRMGDRILVLKCLYPFAEPDRFDVVVFKNPTDPDGEAENYIKRLVGLPGESVWLVDGDVFVADADDAGDASAYRIQRKPDHVQRAVWQPVHHSDYPPTEPAWLSPPYEGPPWTGAGWKIDGSRTYRCDVLGRTMLTWDNGRRVTTDWTPYNMFSLAGTSRARDQKNVSDLRVAADIVTDAEGLATTLEIEVRRHRFRFSIGGGEARMAVVPAGGGEAIAEQVSELEMPAPGRVYSVEFWHVDQSMHLYVNGHRVGEPLTYAWTPRERIENAFGVPYEAWAARSPRITAPAPQMRWSFEGSPVTLHHVRVDRDLYYRPDTLTGQATRNPTQPGYEHLVASGTTAFGTHPDKPAVLGPDHYFMLGDNSPASSDSRLWGNAHPLVAQQIDDSPFVVHRRLLLGKAWVVYFPAPHPVTDNGRSVVPNFGRMRFIR